MKNVVVLGAGMAGLTTARALRPLLNESDRITLIDCASGHVQGLSMLWLLRGWRTLDEVTMDYSEVEIEGVDRVDAVVADIDTDARCVETTVGPFVYDALVCAMGAELHLEGVPGLQQAIRAGHAVHYYSAAAALRAHDRLMQVRQGRVVLAVCGVPYKCPGAPYEGAMLAADLLRENGVRSKVSVEVCTPEPAPMPVAGPAVGEGVQSMMRAMGISFRPSTPLKAVDASRQVLHCGDDTELPYDTLIAIPPHQAPSAIKGLGLSPAGWAPVDPKTMATSIEGLWALGDNAMITLNNGKPLPKAGVFAKGQALTVAAEVARFLGYGVPAQPYAGLGHCYLESGGLQAARGAGDFYHPGAPEVVLEHASAELHREKELEEAEWLSQWTCRQQPFLSARAA